MLEYSKRKQHIQQELQLCKEELINDAKPYQGNFNTPNGKVISIYFVQMLNKFNSIQTLFDNDQIDSIYPIARCEIETYAILLNLIQRYDDSIEFKKYYNKLIAEGFKQDRAIRNDLCETDDEYITYVDAWREILKENFPGSKYDDNDSVENKVKQVINTNTSEHITERVKRALESNTYLQDENGTYSDAKFVYRFLCMESHANYAAVGSRSRDATSSWINVNCNDKNLEPLLETLMMCLKYVGQLIIEHMN
jgi:hypothetical protein